jgi:hypothetical protein
MHAKKNIWLGLALFGVSMQVHADEAELYLSDESIQGRYATGADLVGLEYGELSAELFANEADDVLGAVGLEFAGMPAAQLPFRFSAGGKLYAATLDVFDDNFLSLAVGGEVAYLLPVQIPARVTGQFFYAPKIITFGDADDLVDLILRLEADVIPRVTGFLGYRLLEADLDDGGGEHELDDNIHVGVRYSF